MDPITSTYNALVRKILKDHRSQLDQWTQRNLPEILQRNQTVYSRRQKAMFRRIAKKVGVPFEDPEAPKTTHVGGSDYRYEMSHCSIEPMPGLLGVIVDQNGKRYGEPTHIHDLRMVLPWFNEVLKQQAARNGTGKKKAEPPDCPF